MNYESNHVPAPDLAEPRQCEFCKVELPFGSIDNACAECADEGFPQGDPIPAEPAESSCGACAYWAHGVCHHPGTLIILHGTSDQCGKFKERKVKP
jgi:hypothetical protein